MLIFVSYLLRPIFLQPTINSKSWFFTLLSSQSVSLSGDLRDRHRRSSHVDPRLQDGDASQVEHRLHLHDHLRLLHLAGHHPPRPLLHHHPRARAEIAHRVRDSQGLGAEPQAGYTHALHRHSRVLHLSAAVSRHDDVGDIHPAAGDRGSRCGGVLLFALFLEDHVLFELGAESDIVHAHVDQVKEDLSPSFEPAVLNVCMGKENK